VKYAGRNPLRPAWNHWPRGFVGPAPHTVGVYLIIKYMGGARESGPTGKARHRYWCKCLFCGAETEVYQQAIRRALKRRSEKCSACARKDPKKPETEYKRERRERWARDLKKWLWVLHKMPVTPIHFVPENKRFDRRTL